MGRFTPQIQEWVLLSEGGYVDHPKDPGGATNMGITLATLKSWRGKAVSKTDVKNLTKAEALAIYKARYWGAVRGDDLPEGLDYAVFDYGVNSGPARAAKALQTLLGVTADGVIGPQTLAALKGRSTVKLIEDLTAQRQRYVRRLKTYATFGKGWENRIADVAAKAGKLAIGLPLAKPIPAEPAYPVPAPEVPPVLPPRIIAVLIALIALAGAAAFIATKFIGG